MAQQYSRGTGVKYMLAGGSVVAALGLLVDPAKLLPGQYPVKDVCQEMVQPLAMP